MPGTIDGSGIKACCLLFDVDEPRGLMELMIKVPLLPVAPVDFVDDLRLPRARARVLGRFTFGTPASPRSPGNRGIEAGPRPASLDVSIRAETFWNQLDKAPGSCSASSAVQRLSSCQGEDAANGQ